MVKLLSSPSCFQQEGPRGQGEGRRGGAAHPQKKEIIRAYLQGYFDPRRKSGQRGEGETPTFSPIEGSRGTRTMSERFGGVSNTNHESQRGKTKRLT